MMYSDLKYQYPVTDVDYHPRDHMIAFCSLGENHPVLLYSYDVQGIIYTVDWLSRSPRVSLKYFEISVLRHNRFAELRKNKLNNHISQMNM